MTFATPSDNSVSEWLAQLNAGDHESMSPLWDRFFARLVRHARHQLANAPRRVADEEDIAMSVFESLLRGADAGRFNNVKNRDQLWMLLTRLSQRKIASYLRRELAKKRGGGIVIQSLDAAEDGEINPEVIEFLVSDEIAPDVIASINEEIDLLFAALRDDVLRKIASLRLEGFTATEIAVRLGCTERTINRKLELIRKTWREAIDP